MIMALRVVLIGYVVFWAVLLVLCLRKRDFCPIFSDSRNTRQFWLATFVLVNPVLTVLYLIFGQLRSPQARPVRAVRDVAVVIAIAGFFLNIPGLTHVWMQPFMGRSAGSAEPGDEPAVTARAAIIEAANNNSASSMTSSSDNNRLACRRMAVIVEGEHPLLVRTGSALAERLEAIPAVEEVELHANGAFPPAGQRAPDVFVRLYLGNIQETPIPYSLKLRAEIGAEVGQSPLASTHHYRDTFMPPLLDFSTNIELTHTSTTTGYESVRYSMAAENIAKELSGQIAKALDQWADKHGLLPELPADVYGQYVPHELPGPLARFEPTLLGSYTGLLTRNETYLQFSLTGEPAESIRSVRDAMTDLGWKELSSDWEPSRIDLRLEKDNRRIHVFQVRPRDPFSGVTVTSDRAQPAPAHLFGIADTQSFSYDERRVVLDGLLTQPYSLEHLMLFERMFDKPQQERWLEILESLPTRDVFAQIRLGEMYQRRDLPDKAAEALKLARALLWAEQDKSRYQSRLKSLAKNLGDEDMAGVVPTRPDFLDAGFIEIEPATDAFEIEVGVGEPALMFYDDPEDEPLVLNIQIASLPSDRDPYEFRRLQRQGGRSIYGTRTGFSQSNGLWHVESQQHINETAVMIRVTQIEGQDRFKVSVTISRP
ncbi:MAG: hypothetical protein JW993_16130 [Sedimentisphaerales bacterium]|nr:hypothetical protein [Sedimentisphaerales bacterium]